MSSTGGAAPQRLGPAWRTSGTGSNRGFQPPPAVPDEDRRERSGSHASGGSGSATGGGDKNRNPFAMLDDEEDAAGGSGGRGNNGPSEPINNNGGGGGRFSNLRSDNPSTAASPSRSYHRAASGPEPKPRMGGRSLADLAARVSDRPSTANDHHRGGDRNHMDHRSARSSSAGITRVRSGSGEGLGYGNMNDHHRDDRDRSESHGSSGGMEGSGSGAKVIRYTREKLLSLRGRGDDGLPDCLKEMEGSVVVSTTSQDPVCWDTFDSDEIWASITRSDRRPGPPGPGPKGPGGRLRDFDSGDESGPPARGSVGGPPHRGSMDRGMDRGSSSGRGGFASGRWQRGVALPEGDTRSNSRGRDDDRGMSRNVEADNPDDLWDDVGAGPSGAASDFSAFGGSLEDDRPKGKTGMGAFDLSDMSAAAAAFEDELHGSKSKADNGTSNGGALEDEDAEGISHQVDASRPLASTGTTIRSGSGDHANVFEDFGDDEDNDGTEEELPIKSGTGDNNASSRLMKMIGVSGTGEASGSGGIAEPKETTKPEESTPPEDETKPRSDSIPSNPWGAPAATSVSSNPWGGPSDPVTQQQKEEELHRQQQRQKQLQEEEEKKRWAAAQAKQQAEMEAKQRQQQEEQLKQQQNQVELVLIERITNILENSWGRSDLNSILSTLHANDSRVIAILSTIDALRQLISRHPQRIQLGRDPTMGAEMAAVRMTNAQWQAHQAQQQAQEQEVQRRKQLQEEQARVAAQQQEALVRAQLEAGERQKQQSRQSSAAPPVITDAPWFYADPQGNVQGPFGGDEMRQWLEAGYFKGDLPISQSPKGPFHTLSSYFSGDANNAFKPTVDSSAEDEKAAAEARAKAEAEARATAEAEAKAKARLEAKAARDREKAELAAAKARADAEAEKDKVDRSQQSTQLKMMLGVGGTGSSDGIAGPPQPEPVAAPPTKKQGKKATQKQQKPTVPVVAQAPVAAEKPSNPPAPAWGGGSKAQARNKSMSEIQQEEAREAARRAKEQGLNGSSSGGGGGGWANIASSGGSSAWGGQAKTPVAGVVVAGVGTAQTQKAGGAAWNKPNAKANAATAKKPAQSQSTASSKNTAVDNFGTDGRMTPTLEVWCKEQMQKINGSDDLTLVQFCLTLTDSDEIRQYLTAYLGSTPQVNNFATEFIKKKGGDNGRQEEWVSNKKGGRKSKKGGK